MTHEKTLESDHGYRHKLAAVGSLAAGIAHEINTPIQFASDNLVFLAESTSQILSLCDLYRKMCQKAASARLTADDIAQIRQAEEDADVDFLATNLPKSIASAGEGLTRVASIAQAMSAFAHPSHEDWVRANLNAVLQETLTIAKNETKYVATVDTCFGDLPGVPCLLSDVKHVFLVLLTNVARALKACAQTAETHVIRVETTCAADHVVVAMGHAVASAPSLESSLGDEDTVELVRSIVVERHRGSLTFESKIGPGERCVVRLPTDPATTPGR